MEQDYIRLAMEKAREGMNAGYGGPFGAAVVKDGEVIVVACNNVLAKHDPTAHAEICAIRDACAKLETHDLTGCVIYATGEPCPMCLSAIIWANISLCCYANTAVQAEHAGFRDELIYRHIRGEERALEVRRIEGCEDCASLYEEYERLSGTMY
jgi:guanine deaminase